PRERHEPPLRRTLFRFPRGPTRGTTRMRRLLATTILLASGLAWAAPVQPPKAQTAPAEARAGETDEGKGTYFPIPVPDEAIHFKDPAIAALAARILSGDADLRERRAWYAMSLLYAPFASLPPDGWRTRALQAGAAISIETRKREAAAAKAAA